MRNMKISDLPYYVGDSEPEVVSFPAAYRGASVKVDLATITESVKKALGYLEKPLIKCQHCGQWGAAYCACPKCGAPIDPEP